MTVFSEFAESKEWVEKELSFDKNVFVSLFETTIRMLGGLLSAYHLSGERVFLDKASDLGSRLIGAFDSPSPVPYSDVNLQSKQGKQPSWGGDSSLSEISSIQLEFRDLSRLTGNPVYEVRMLNSAFVQCSVFTFLALLFYFLLLQTRGDSWHFAL
jgi:uncharacterized protein YyaL (SSP411 family)